MYDRSITCCPSDTDSEEVKRTIFSSLNFVLLLSVLKYEFNENIQQSYVKEIDVPNLERKYLIK
jgi:hypothetical protein